MDTRKSHIHTDFFITLKELNYFLTDFSMPRRRWIKVFNKKTDFNKKKLGTIRYAQIQAQI